MKAILMSIRPKWVAKILNGEKTVEVRKRFPKDYRGWVYIYCTKLVPYGYGCMYDEMSKKYETTFCNSGKELPNLTGKVVARFWCDNVEQYINGCKLNGEYSDYEYILKPSCLTEDELYDYCEDLSFSAIYITKLEIFDRPRELSEFIQTKRKSWEEPNIIKAPQSWCYVESEEWYV